MACTNVYEKLYLNMRNRFTVEDKNQDMTLGEYMLMKSEQTALALKNNNTALAPVVSRGGVAILEGVKDYIYDKLVIKTPPAKEKTIFRFPFRTSITSFFSAVAVCALLISCAVTTLAVSISKGGESGIVSSEVVDPQITDGDITVTSL